MWVLLQTTLLLLFFLTKVWREICWKEMGHMMLQHTHTLKIVIKCLYGNFLKTTSSQIIGSIIVNDVCFIWWNWVVTRSSHWHIFVSSQKIICLLHLASTFCVQRIFFLWKSKGTKNPCQMKIMKRLAHFSSWLSHTHVEIIDDILVLFILPDVDNCD